jgi:hypothetical protein
MSERPASPPPSFRRRVMPAGRALVVIFVTLLVWALLYAPELRRSAEAAPTGTRRTVSLAILNPLVWFTDHTGLTAAANAASRAAGRDPNAEVGRGERRGRPHSRRRRRAASRSTTRRS